MLHFEQNRGERFSFCLKRRLYLKRRKREILPSTVVLPIDLPLIEIKTVNSRKGIKKDATIVSVHATMTRI